MEHKQYQQESYTGYQKRIQELVDHRACFPPEWENLATAAGLKQKFCDDGSFRDFFGDTVVFPLPGEQKCLLGELQESLYRLAGEMLSERLPADSLHITLHDLSAAPQFSDIQAEAEAHRDAVLKKLTALRSKGFVHIWAKGMVSMVSSSIVMLFAPVCETDHSVIQDLYGQLEEICPLPYPLTLHCTLAYYKPGVYTPEEWNRLWQFIRQWNSQNPENLAVALDSGEITYQVFQSMREYHSV